MSRDIYTSSDMPRSFYMAAVRQPFLICNSRNKNEYNKIKDFRKYFHSQETEETMRYITGVQALNLPCRLNTAGDWHASQIRWEPLRFAESDGSFFGDYGIERGKKVPLHEGTFAAADHIRAVLDLLLAENFLNAQGMKKDYIGTDEYTEEIFGKVWQMRRLPIWRAVDRFMEKEYRMEWVRFRASQGAGLYFARERGPRSAPCKVRGGRALQEDSLAFSVQDDFDALCRIIDTCKDSFESLSNDEKDMLSLAFEYSGEEKFEYLLEREALPEEEKRS